MAETATLTQGRPWTEDTKTPTGATRVTVKRNCNGCDRTLGDATDAELTAAVLGRPLPDVRPECGCAEAGQRYVRTSLPPDHPEISNDTWWHMRLCMDCCPVEFTRPIPPAGGAR